MNLIDASRVNDGANQTHFIRDSQLLPDDKSFVSEKLEFVKNLFETNNEGQGGLKFKYGLTYKFPWSDQVFKLKYKELEDYLTTDGYKTLLYESGELFYEGQIKNNKIYGKDIKLYHKHDNAVLIDISSIEGDNYLDNINAQVIQYYSNSKLKFKGQLIDGMISGYGKKFHDNGKVYYEGQYLNGGIHGDKVCIYNSQGKYILNEENLISGRIRDRTINNKIYTY